MSRPKKIDWETIAKELWGLLDDIDTYPDMIKPDTPLGHELCWKMMLKRAEKRHNYLESDGYNLTLVKSSKVPKPTPTPAAVPKEPDNTPPTQSDSKDNALPAIAEASINPQNITYVPKKENLPTFIRTLKPKRKRRTKTEMQAAKEIVKPELELPPRWKCPDIKSCGWIGDIPHKAKRGINTGKLICPKCKMIVVKNE